MAACDIIVDNLKESLQDLGGKGITKNGFVAKRTALGMAMSMDVVDKRLTAFAARVLGIDQQNIRLAADRNQTIKDYGLQSKLWAIDMQALKQSQIPDEVKGYMKAFGMT